MTMTKTLTPKQRAKINAALILIQDLGGDAKGCIALAEHYRGHGRDVRSAYEAALNAFIGDHPDMGEPVGKALRLIEASDNATVDKYDIALSDYAVTGNSDALDALAPMVAQDSLTLAIRSGDITAEEAETMPLSALLGFEVAPELEGVTAKDMAADAPNGQGQEQGHVAADRALGGEQTNTINGGDEMTNSHRAAPAQAVRSTDAQVSLGMGATGYVSPKTAANWSRNTTAALPNGAAVAPAV